MLHLLSCISLDKYIKVITKPLSQKQISDSLSTHSVQQCSESQLFRIFDVKKYDLFSCRILSSLIQ